jgi:hypothetical protein
VLGYVVPAFDYSDPASMVSTVTFFNSSLQFPRWKVRAGRRGLGRDRTADGGC